MTRTRQRFHTGYYNSTGYYRPIATFKEIPVSSSYNNLEHTRHIPVSGQVWSGSGNTYSQFIATDDDFFHHLATARSYTDQPFAIPWHKLPSSSDFNSVAFLAELKESIGMFSVRTIRNILKDPKGLYGFLEFGFSPFISDLVAILSLIEQVRERLKGGKLQEFRTSYVQTFDMQKVQIGNTYYWVQGTASVRFNGAITNSLTDLPALADFVGFKPDLASLYELTPLSFVLDYFLPIGDYLDNISRSGWVSSTLFEGSISQNVVLQYNSSTRPDLQVLCSTLYYSREYVSTTIPVKKVDKPIDIDFPSLKQAFNTIYIAVSSLSGGLSYKKYIDANRKVRRKLKL